MSAARILRAAVLAAALVLAGVANTWAATVRVTVSPPDAAQQIKLSSPLADETLLDPVAGPTNDIQLPSPNGDLPDRRSIFVKWSDGSQSDFPIVLTSALGSRRFDMYFVRPPGPSPLPTLADVQRECNIARPTSIEAAFRAYYMCRNYALAVEQDSRWFPIHRVAIAGWFIANYALYTRFPPLSPYGFDPELADRLREAIALVKDNKYRADKLSPMRVADFERALRELADEPVRAAGLVPQLIQDGQLATADRLNRLALDAFDAADANSVITSYGVNRDLLMGNQSLIDRLIANEPGSPRL